MEEQREESEFVCDYGEPMEEIGKGLGLASNSKTLDGEFDIEDANTVVVSDSDVCDVSDFDENPNHGGSATEDGNADNSVSDEKLARLDVRSVEDSVEKTISYDDVETTDAITEPETYRNQIERDGDSGTVEVRSVHGESHESAGEEETVISDGNEVTDEKENCEVEENGGAYDSEENVQTEVSQQSSVDDETLSVAEDESDQEEESARESEEDNKEMDVDGKHSIEENDALHDPGSETKDAKHSESAKVPVEPNQRSKGEANEENPGTVLEVSSAGVICREEEITSVNQIEENGEAMEIDYATEELVVKNVTLGGVLDNAGIQTQVGRIAEAGGNDSNVVNEMEIDVDMSTDLTGSIESADSENQNNASEDSATGGVEPLDHNAFFDPSSDITNFIDFSGVSTWSGIIQDLKTETNVSLVEDKKAAVMGEEVATVETLKSVDATVNAESHDNLSISAEGIQNGSTEACIAFGAEYSDSATEFPREASDAIMGSDENQEEKGHGCLDQKLVDQQDAMGEEDESTHEAPSIEPTQKEDTETEENPNNFDYAVDGSDSDIKTKGVKRKADVLSEDSLGKGRKTISLAKVSFSQNPSFKIGACITRAASQMAGSPSVLNGSSFGDETLSVESFVSQLHGAAVDPDKENVVSEIAAGFFLDFRNSSASQQVTPKKVGNKRGRPSNSNEGGTETFEFEEMGDAYWTDRVIHNGGEEQTPMTEKGNYEIVPVDLKPAQVKKTRRPYRRRQSQISTPPPSASDKPANYDANAPAELIMKFSETDVIPPEKSLSKMFRHFGPIRELQTEVDKENNRARVVYRKSTDAEVAYNSAGRFSIFGTKTVYYELSYTITEAFKVEPYVVSLGEENAALCFSS